MKITLLMILYTSTPANMFDVRGINTLQFTSTAECHNIGKQWVERELRDKAAVNPNITNDPSALHKAYSCHVVRP
jgi:hypothetical protein